MARAESMTRSTNLLHEKRGFDGPCSFRFSHTDAASTTEGVCPYRRVRGPDVQMATREAVFPRPVDLKKSQAIRYQSIRK